jgi:hypothetical protein
VGTLLEIVDVLEIVDDGEDITCHLDQFLFINQCARVPVDIMSRGHHVFSWTS